MRFDDVELPPIWQTVKRRKKRIAVRNQMSTFAHNRSSNILLNAALLAGQKGMLADSEKMFAKAILLKEKSAGRGTEYATMLVSFADMYMDNENAAKAEPLYAEALRILSSSHGDDHLSIALLMRSLSEACHRLGRENESHEWCLQAKKILKQHRRCS
jgi:hypothetical protein